MSTVSSERVCNSVLICTSLGLLTGCGFVAIHDPSGFDLPEQPQWSFDPGDALPMVEANTAVYVFEMPEGENLSIVYSTKGERKPVQKRYFYYRFFPRGRVFFNVLPIDDAGLQRAIQSDGSLILPEGLEFDDFHDGYVGRYRLEGSRIELEFFRFGRGRWSFPFGVDHHYVYEEGELTPSGFRITNVSERHRFSWNNGSYVTLRAVRRTPVAGEMKRAANW